MRVGRLWNVVCHIYRHILVEVVARIKLTGARTRILACVQPHRVFERSEIPVDGQRCRSEHDRFRLRVQLVFKSLAHIDDERLQLIRLLVLLSAQLRSVSVAVRLLAEDRPRLLPRGLSNPSLQRRFRAGACRTLDALKIADELLIAGNRLFRACLHSLCKRSQRTERL